MPLTLLLFEDNSELRSMLVKLINTSNKYLLLGDYPDVLNISELVIEKNPDLIVLDINMPGRSGIEAISIIKEARPDTFIIMYTQFEDDDKLFKCLCAGADGYILKKTSLYSLLNAIEEVCNGGSPLSPTIAKKVLHSFRNKTKTSWTHFHLTTRETEILKLLVKGYSVKLIAAEVGITYDTGRSHLRNIYRKLHVNCGKEAIAKILAEKIIS